MFLNGVGIPKAEWRGEDSLKNTLIKLLITAQETKLEREIDLIAAIAPIRGDLGPAFVGRTQVPLLGNVQTSHTDIFEGHGKKKKKKNH